jgi:hypothetical protein
MSDPAWRERYRIRAGVEGTISQGVRAFAAVAERPEHTHQGYRRFRGCEFGKQFNGRSGGLPNRTQHPSGVVALVVLWRLR